MVESIIPRHITGIYVFAVINLLALICVKGVQCDVIVIDLESNTTVDTFADMQARFGPGFPIDGLEGRVIYADPHTACTKLKNPAPTQKDKYVWILLIARGDCQFATKVLNAQMGNYEAAIVHNFLDVDTLTVMGGDNSSVKIPSTFVGWTTGKYLATKYNFSTKNIVKIKEEPQFDYKMYLWPFAIVVTVCFLIVMVFFVIKFVRDHANVRLNRLSKKHLKKIPVRKFKKGDYYDTCAICLDEYEEGEKIRVLPCDHVYHTKCIDPWLTKNKKTCPVCKRRVIPGTDADSSDSDSDEGRASAENTPLLMGGARSVQQPVLTNYTNGTAVLTPPEDQPLAVGGVGVSHVEALVGQTSAEASVEKEDGANEVSGRRRRRQERRSAATLGLEEEMVGGAAAQENGETREERRERKKKKKEKKEKKRRVKAEKPSRNVQDLETGAGPEQTLPRPEEEEEFASAPSSFRETRAALLPTSATRVRDAQPQRGAEADESYINPSYSESQEMAVAEGEKKQEMHVVV